MDLVHNDVIIWDPMLCAFCTRQNFVVPPLSYVKYLKDLSFFGVLQDLTVSQTI